MNRGNLSVAFAATGTGLTINGQDYGLRDGVLVPVKQVTAPAIMRHQMTSGRYGLNQSDIGQMIETDNLCQGILLAPHFRHVSRQGQPIGPKFDYFTTKANTWSLIEGCKRAVATYDQDIQRIAGLDTYGHKGILLHNDKKIYDVAQNNPEKLAGWHMPVQALVNGYDAGRTLKQRNPDNMYERREKGQLNGSFVTENFSNGHWTASGLLANSRVYVVFLASGNDGFGHKDLKDVRLSRPVRAVVRNDI